MALGQLPSAMRDIEEIIRDGMDFERERARGRLGYSLVPLLVFLSDTANIARGQERQAIMDALPQLGAHKNDAAWNAGFKAAMNAVTRLLIERSVAP